MRVSAGKGNLRARLGGAASLAVLAASLTVALPAPAGATTQTLGDQLSSLDTQIHAVTTELQTDQAKLTELTSQLQATAAFVPLEPSFVHSSLPATDVAQRAQLVIAIGQLSAESATLDAQFNALTGDADAARNTAWAAQAAEPTTAPAAPAPDTPATPAPDPTATTATTATTTVDPSSLPAPSAAVGSVTAPQEWAGQDATGATPSTVQNPQVGAAPVSTPIPSPEPSDARSGGAQLAATTTLPTLDTASITAPSPEAALAVQSALSQLGVPYLWGGNEPSTGFDCSGLMQWAYAQAGVTLPRVTYAQWNIGSHVAPSQLAPGDLVFFDDVGHVGMYIGYGLVVEAPHTGDVVKVNSLQTMAAEDGYVGAIRPL